MFKSLLVLCATKSTVNRIDIESGKVTTIVENTGPIPDGIVYSKKTDRLYWTLMGEPKLLRQPMIESNLDFSIKNGGIASAKLDGSEQGMVLPYGSITTGKQITLNDEAGLLFFCDREGAKVCRVDIDGSNLTDLVVNTPKEDILNQPVGVAIDNKAGHIYWTQKGPSDGYKGRIFRAGLDIPVGQNASNRSDIEVLWDGLPEPIDLFVDHERGEIYWTDRSTNALNRSIIPPLGSRGQTPEILADGFKISVIGLEIDTDARIAYVADHAGEVIAVSLEKKEGAYPQKRITQIGDMINGICGV